LNHDCIARRSGLAAAATLFGLVLAACSQQPAVSAPQILTDADRAAILSALGLSGNPQGQVMNECSELVTPQFLQAELGGIVGTATLFAISGGPKAAACYGDGPALHLMMRDGSRWREIYSARGRVLIILPTSTSGVLDIGDGGPGFSFPVWSWNGSQYAPTGREISDAELPKVGAKYLP
jgi:hypothetical protein